MKIIPFTDDKLVGLFADRTVRCWSRIDGLNPINAVIMCHNVVLISDQWTIGFGVILDNHAARIFTENGSIDLSIGTDNILDSIVNLWSSDNILIAFGQKTVYYYLVIDARELVLIDTKVLEYFTMFNLHRTSDEIINNLWLNLACGHVKTCDNRIYAISVNKFSGKIDCCIREIMLAVNEEESRETVSKVIEILRCGGFLYFLTCDGQIYTKAFSVTPDGVLTNVFKPLDLSLIEDYDESYGTCITKIVSGNDTSDLFLRMANGLWLQIYVCWEINRASRRRLRVIGDNIKDIMTYAYPSVRCIRLRPPCVGYVRRTDNTVQCFAADNNGIRFSINNNSIPCNLSHLGLIVLSNEEIIRFLTLTTGQVYIDHTGEAEIDMPVLEKLPYFDDNASMVPHCRMDLKSSRSVIRD